MAVIDIKTDPTRKDLLVFAALWTLFFLVLGAIALGTETALLKMAGVTGACFLVSFALNRDYPRRSQLLGLLIPLVLLGVWALERLGDGSGGWLGQRHTLGRHDYTTAQLAVLCGMIAVGLAGGLAAALSPMAGRTLYRGWMFAALPIGWTISHLILGVVFYAVMTPLGLLMRATGKDPMDRRFDRAARTYWIPHRQETDPKRYFRQF